MDKGTLESLDYSKIIDKLSNYAFTKGGKELAAGLLPYDTFEEVKTALSETTTARNFLDVEGDLPFIEFVDVEPLFDKIRVLSLLTPEELLRVSDVLSTIGEIKEIGESFRDSYPDIFNIQ